MLQWKSTVVERCQFLACKNRHRPFQGGFRLGPALPKVINNFDHVGEPVSGLTATLHLQPRGGPPTRTTFPPTNGEFCHTSSGDNPPRERDRFTACPTACPPIAGAVLGLRPAPCRQLMTKSSRGDRLSAWSQSCRSLGGLGTTCKTHTTYLPPTTLPEI